MLNITSQFSVTLQGLLDNISQHNSDAFMQW